MDRLVNIGNHLLHLPLGPFNWNLFKAMRRVRALGTGHRRSPGRTIYGSC